MKIVLIKLAKEFCKLIITNVKKSTITFYRYYLGCLSCWHAVLSKFHKGFRFLSCAIVIFSKYTWVIPLKNKKSITVNNAFQKKLKMTWKFNYT